METANVLWLHELSLATKPEARLTVAMASMNRVPNFMVETNLNDAINLTINIAALSHQQRNEKVAGDEEEYFCDIRNPKQKRGGGWVVIGE